MDREGQDHDLRTERNRFREFWEDPSTQSGGADRNVRPRRFNVYTGTLCRAEFDRIVTHADGAVGVQIARPIRELIVHRGIETFGGTGPSLVKGVVTNLSAIALSIKEGGSVQRIEIEGGIRTHGKGVLPIEQLGKCSELKS